MTIAQALRDRAAADPDLVLDAVINLSRLDDERLAALVGAGLRAPEPIVEFDQVAGSDRAGDLQDLDAVPGVVEISDAPEQHAL